MRLVAFLIMCSLLLGTSFAIGEDIGVALNRFCAGTKDMLPSAAMLMVVLGAVLYAAGQMMGAETRARANVWATAALTGALVAILIATITPVFLNQIYGAGVFCVPPNGNCVNGGNFVCSGNTPYCYRCMRISDGALGDGSCFAATPHPNGYVCHVV